MNKLKKLCGSLAVALTLTFSNSAHAGIPVVDIPALVSLVQQVLSWVEQYGQMVEELEQLEAQYNQQVQQYEALTGSRSLGELLSNSALRQVVPNDLVATYDSVRTSGYSGLSGAARGLRDASKVYNCEDRVGADKTTCEALLNGNAQTRATVGTALDWTKKRGDNIEGLQAEISATDDPKAIAELQARIAAEHAQVANDANRVVIMAENARAQREAVQQQRKEHELQWLSKPGDGTAGFAFVVE